MGLYVLIETQEPGSYPKWLQYENVRKATREEMQERYEMECNLKHICFDGSLPTPTQNMRHSRIKELIGNLRPLQQELDELLQIEWNNTEENINIDMQNHKTVFRSITCQTPG